MINTLTRNATIIASLATVVFAVSTPAFSQAPTDAQRSAIRSQCRSDYMAHCSSVPPGGEASLQCLQKNIASLSAGCQGAVRAVEPPAAPKAEAAPPKTEPAAAPKTELAAAPKTEPAPAVAAKPAEAAAPPPAPKAAETAAPAAAPNTSATKAAASTGAKKPSDAQIAAIRSSCRADYPKVCAGVPTGGEAALSCLDKNKTKVSASCQQALNAASGGGAAPAKGGAPAAATAAAPAAAPTAAPAPVLVLRPMRPAEELFVVRSACGGDVRALCGGVAPGGGRIIQCLATQVASISPACKEVLGQFAAQ